MKKSLKKQAVFPVLMLLVVTALALVGSSFAWFSVANQASVATITGTAEDGGVGLMISDKYNGTFAGSIEMTAQADHFILPKYLKQLSSADAESFFAGEIKSKNADGTVDTIHSKAFSNYYNGTAEGQTANTAAGAGTYGYIDFTVYLQVEQDAYLFLDYGTSLVIAAPTNGQRQTGAFRVAIGDPVAVDTNETYQAGQTPKSTSFTKIYGDEAEDDWYPIVEDSSAADPAVEPFAAYSQVTTYSPNLKEVDAFSGMIAAENELSSFTEMTEAQAEQHDYLCELSAGVNAITFRIWLEGNDSDCTVEVALNTIALTLEFFACKKIAAQQNNG